MIPSVRIDRHWQFRAEVMKTFKWHGSRCEIPAPDAGRRGRQDGNALQIYVPYSFVALMNYNDDEFMYRMKRDIILLFEFIYKMELDLVQIFKWIAP